MSEPRTDAGRWLVATMTPPLVGAGCDHQGESWFDRSECADPCGSMHERCAECGSALGGCYFEGPIFVERTRREWTLNVIAIEEEAVSLARDEEEA